MLNSLGKSWVTSGGAGMLVAGPVLLLCVAALAVGCRRRNEPGPKDDVVIDVPGVTARAGEDGVTVRAPLGIAVDVTKDGVSVKAPGVRVNATVDAGVNVKAPGVRVESTASGTSVDAFGVKVRAGDTK